MPDIAVGQRFGRWLCVGEPTRIVHNEHRSRLYAVMQCDCGVRKLVAKSSLNSGCSRSCGCLAREETARRKTTHGLRHSPFYSTWTAAKERCENPNSRQYPDYGGRGIRMWAAWRNDFPAYHNYIMDALGPKPTPAHSLDRIDNDRGYEPGNLRWATKSEQNLNRRKLVKLRDLAMVG